MTTSLPHVAAWAKSQATLNRDRYFDLAVAVIQDGVTDESKASDVIAECAKHDVDVTSLLALQCIRVATRWGLDKLNERRKTFNSFRPVETLVNQINAKPASADVPVLTDGTVDTETVYASLVATGKPITHRMVLAAVGKPHWAHPDKGKSVVDSPDVFTVAATMTADDLSDRLAADPAFRSKIIDLAVEAAIASKPEASTKTPKAIEALAKPLAKLDLIVEAQKAGDILRRLEAAAAVDDTVAGLLQEVLTTTVTPAYDLLMLTLNGFPTA